MSVVHSRSSKAQVTVPELRQHFQNYFELLLNYERERLQNTVSRECAEGLDCRAEEIERRISYLRGAVRMGKLLCLIDYDEAKVKYDLLAAERESLLASCAGDDGDITPQPSNRVTASKQRTHLKKLMATITPSVQT